MLTQSAGSWTAAVTAFVALLGAILGVLRYFNYRTKRDRIAAVGAAFETVVAALASKSEIKQLAAAIRLRRFFDPGSEVGAAGAAYSRDALGVIVAILREQPTGNLQKLLADGLTHAPTLVGADLQRTNLQGAYLGRANVSGADFYRADLSGASLKRAVAQGTVFYQAKLVGTVCSGADLRGANFYEADLTRVRFEGALLAGAAFVGSNAIPPGGRLPSRREWPVYRPGWTAAIRPTSSHYSSTGFRESPIDAYLFTAGGVATRRRHPGSGGRRGRDLREERVSTCRCS